MEGNDMDELISKRAVIEAIEKARANVGHNLERSIGKSIIEILDDVGRDVDRLPSAHGTNLAEVGTDLISRQKAIEVVQNRHMMLSKEKVLLINDIEKLPSEEPEFIKCDYVKACNEVTMNKTFSAWGYLAMLDDFEEYGYVLVKRRG